MGLPEVRIRKWKCEDKWENTGNRTFRYEEKERSESKELDLKLSAMVEENEGLNDKQKLFCLLYVKSFNATRSYQRAYGCSYETALTKGPALLKNPKAQDEIQRLKTERNLALMADVNDLVELHILIAFGDITDFVEFGRKEVPVMGSFGPVEIDDPETGEKVPLMKEVNDMRFRESTEIDGRLISKVKVGKDGASIEIEGREKSRAFLERWFEANPMDKHKKAYDNARLEIERKRTEPEKPDNEVVYRFDDPREDEISE